MATPGNNFTAIPIWGDNGNYVFNLSHALVISAQTYLNSLASTNIVAPQINPNFPTVSAPPLPVTAPQPTLQQVFWQVPVQPAPFTGVLNLGNLLPAPFTGTPPALNFGTPPAPFSTPAPASPPINLNFTYPTVGVTLPNPPQLLTLDTVQFPALTIPTFNANVPNLTAVAPNTFRYVEGPGYTSTLLTQLQGDLTNALSEGTWTGLPPIIEAGIWDRGRDREYRQMADAFAELDRMEAMGFAFPPGVFIEARLKLQTEMQYTTASLSREVMIKQAELQLQNIVEARKVSMELERHLAQIANEVAQRAFESAKYATEAAIAIYNAQVQAYTASLDGFKTEAIVYDTLIKGILAQVEITKANIAFEEAKASINTAIVEQYKGEVQAAEAILEVFKTQVQIIQTQATVEQIKVSVFGEQIKAYVGQINAYTAQVEGYKAQAEAQGVIETVYKTQVDAFAAQVNAGVAEINAQVAAYRGQIDAYTATLEGYKASIQGMVGQAQAASLFNTAAADVFRSQTGALTSYNGVLTAQWQAVLNEQEKIAEVGVAAAKANGDLFIATRGLALDASKVGAQVSAQLGAAALGAIHWANNSSWSNTQADTFGISTTSSTSQVTENLNIASV